MAFLNVNEISVCMEISRTNQSRSTFTQLKEAATEIFGDEALVLTSVEIASRYFLVIPETGISKRKLGQFRKKIEFV